MLLEIVVSLKALVMWSYPHLSTSRYCPSSLSDAVFSHILSVAVRDCGSQFLDVSTELLSLLQLLLQPLGAQPVLPLLSYCRGSCCRQTDRHSVRVTADNGHNKAATQSFCDCTVKTTEP